MDLSNSLVFVLFALIGSFWEWGGQKAIVFGSRTHTNHNPQRELKSWASGPFCCGRRFNFTNCKQTDSLSTHELLHVVEAPGSPYKIGIEGEISIGDVDFGAGLCEFSRIWVGGRKEDGLRHISGGGRVVQTLLILQSISEAVSRSPPGNPHVLGPLT